MTNVTISRELLERIDESAICDGTDATISDDLFTQLVGALDAPRQPEGDAISLERVQAEADAFFDWPTADKSSVTTKSCLIFARCMAGMVAAERDATIAELREEISDLHTTMMAAAVEIQEHWPAHCDEEGYGPANLMNRLERGIAAQYGYTAQTVVQIEAERDTLRQQLAELRAQLLAIASAEPRRHTIEWAKAMAATGNNEAYAKWREAFDQRDRLAGLLRHASSVLGSQGWDALTHEIDAALAEVKP